MDATLAKDVTSTVLLAIVLTWLGRVGYIKLMESIEKQATLWKEVMTAQGETFKEVVSQLKTMVTEQRTDFLRHNIEQRKDHHELVLKLEDTHREMLQEIRTSIKAVEKGVINGRGQNRGE